MLTRGGERRGERRGERERPPRGEGERPPRPRGDGDLFPAFPHQHLQTLASPPRRPRKKQEEEGVAGE